MHRTTRIFLAYAVALLGLTLLSGCAGGKHGSPFWEPQSHRLRLTSGETRDISIPLGDFLLLELPSPTLESYVLENPEYNGNNVKHTGFDFTPPPPNGKRFGDFGRNQYSFEAIGKGESRIVFFVKESKDALEARPYGTVRITVTD